MEREKERERDCIKIVGWKLKGANIVKKSCHFKGSQ